MSRCPRWGDEKTLLFVMNYREQRCLWDASSPMYRNKFARGQAYKSFIEAVNDPNLNVTTIKMKIRSLRSTYCQELKKIKDAASAGTSYSPKLSWFHEMHSCVTPAETLESRSNVDLQRKEGSSNTNTAEIEYETNSPTRESFQSEDEDDHNRMLQLTKNEQKVSVIQQRISQTMNKQKLINKRRKICSAQKVKNKQRQMERPSELALNNVTSTSRPVYDDEFHLFGLNVAAQLRTLPLHLALQMQGKIQDNLFEARIQGTISRCKRSFARSSSDADINPLEINDEEETSPVKFEDDY